MKTFLSGLALAFAFTMLVNSAHSSSRTVYVYDNPGGYIRDFVVKKHEYERLGFSVEFYGTCDSACTIFLGLPNICVGPNARFGFHKPYYEDRPNDPVAVSKATQVIMKHYPHWVKKWIKQNGGLKKQIEYIPNDIVRKHVKECA